MGLIETKVRKAKELKARQRYQNRWGNVKKAKQSFPYISYIPSGATLKVSFGFETPEPRNNKQVSDANTLDLIPDGNGGFK